MKKLLTALLALTAILFVSCNDNSTKVLKPESSDFTLIATMDTTIHVKVPVQSPIHMCSGGASKYNKITNWKDSVIVLHKEEKITLSKKEMNDKGWYYFPDALKITDQSVVDKTSTTSNSSFNWLPDWLKTILALFFWGILILLALILGAWLLREFWRLLNRPNTNVTSEQHNVEGNQVVTNPVQRPTPPKPATAEEITAMAALATVIKDGGGGNASKGDMLISINGIQPPLIQITNSGSNSQSGDVTVLIGDTFIETEDDAK